MSTPSKPSFRGSADGFSLFELLVAMMVTGVIAGATLSIALSSHGMFETDRHRTTINQNLRAGLDMVGIDVRQAGERLPFDAPAVDIDVAANPFRQRLGWIVDRPVMGPVVQAEVTIHAITAISQPDHDTNFLFQRIFLMLGGNEPNDIPASQMLCAVPDKPDHYLVGQRMEDLLE